MSDNITKSFYDLETEEIVLSALILEHQAITDVIEIISPEMFFDFRCKAIYEALLEMHDKNEAVDLATLANKLAQRNKLLDIGGYVYISSICEKVASSAHLAHHARIIYQYFYQRQLAKIFSTHLQAIANNEFADILDIYTSAVSQLEQIENKIISNGMARISNSLSDAQKSIYKRVEAYRNNQFVGIPTGLTGLNRITGGWQGNQLIVIAGRPAMGKTAFLLFQAISASMADQHVCIYSLEMGTVSLLDRMIHRNTEIDEFAYKKGSMTNLQLQEIEQSISKLQELNIYIDDKPSCTMRYIRTNAKLLHKQGKCNIIFIDYLQIMDMAVAGRNREQEVSNTTRELKKLAKELNIPVIALAQLGRGVESRPDKKPILSDLRESGAIEQDADIVIFLYRPAVYGIDTITDGVQEIDTFGMGEIIVAKHRDGPVGSIKFSHNPSLTKITDYNQNFMPSMADPPIMPQNEKLPF